MAVSKKFRWTNDNGETLEVEFGADSANVDVNGKALSDIISKLQTTTDKSLKYMGVCDSTKSIDDYNTDESYGVWQIGAGSTPSDMPAARAANENVLLIVSKAYGSGTHCKQELIYTAQNIILNRTYGSSWNAWQFGATTTSDTKSGNKFVTFSAGSKGELTESEYTPDMFLRSDVENEAGSFKSLTVAYPVVTAETAVEKFTSGAYYDARTATSTSWSPVTASEGQEEICQISDYEADCNYPYWIKSEGDIILPNRFYNNVAYYSSETEKFDFRIVLISEIPNDTTARTIISLFNSNTVVQRNGAYGLRIVSKYGVNGTALATSNYISASGLMAIAIEGSNDGSSMKLTAVPISEDFSSVGDTVETVMTMPSPAYIGNISGTTNFINNTSNIYSMYLETAAGVDTLSATTTGDIINAMREMFLLGTDDVASVGYVNSKTDAIIKEIDEKYSSVYAIYNFSGGNDNGWSAMAGVGEIANIENIGNCLWIHSAKWCSAVVNLGKAENFTDGVKYKVIINMAGESESSDSLKVGVQLNKFGSVQTGNTQVVYEQFTTVSSAANGISRYEFEFGFNSSDFSDGDGNVYLCVFDYSGITGSNIYITNVEVDALCSNSSRQPYFAVCDTALETAEKVISVPEITELYDGLRVTVRFANGLKAGIPPATLKINDFDAYVIMINSIDTTYSLDSDFENGYTCDLIYYDEAFTMPVTGFTDTARFAITAMLDSKNDNISDKFDDIEEKLGSIDIIDLYQKTVDGENVLYINEDVNLVKGSVLNLKLKENLPASKENECAIPFYINDNAYQINWSDILFVTTDCDMWFDDAYGKRPRIPAGYVFTCYYDGEGLFLCKDLISQYSERSISSYAANESDIAYRNLLCLCDTEDTVNTNSIVKNAALQDSSYLDASMLEDGIKIDIKFANGFSITSSTNIYVSLSPFDLTIPLMLNTVDNIANYYFDGSGVKLAEEGQILEFIYHKDTISGDILVLSSDPSGLSISAENARMVTGGGAINGLRYTGVDNITDYCVCDSTGSTVIKTVEVTEGLLNFAVQTGSHISVKFSYTNTINSPLLKVGTSTAYSMKYAGESICPGMLVANKIYDFIFDGQYWQLTTAPDPSTSTVTSSSDWHKVISVCNTDGSGSEISFDVPLILSLSGSSYHDALFYISGCVSDPRIMRIGGEIDSYGLWRLIRTNNTLYLQISNTLDDTETVTVKMLSKPTNVTVSQYIFNSFGSNVVVCASGAGGGDNYVIETPYGIKSAFLTTDYLVSAIDVETDNYSLCLGSYANNDNNSYTSRILIGKGESDSARSNAFRVSRTGATYGYGSFNTTGADYGELMEWLDGNADNEDRCGSFVTFDIDADSGSIKMKKAASSDKIFGVISANASVVGNNFADEWCDMYLRDVYGRLLMDEVSEDVDGEIITKKIPRLNPEYNSEMNYISRLDRPEWDIIGMLGQIVVDDDGTCVVGQPCKCNDDSKATLSDDGTGYMVLNRIDDSHIRIWFNTMGLIRNN